MCHYKCCHICIIQIAAGICSRIYLNPVRDNVSVSVISSHLRCNIETLHFTPIICWTLDTGVRERGERGAEGGGREEKPI